MKKRDLILASIVIFVVWEAIALVARVSILPPPTEVLAVFFERFPHELGWHFLVSTWRVVASIALAIVTAVPLGMAMGQMPWLDRVFAPFVYVFYPIPKIVFLPIFLLILGIGNVSKIAIISLILFFQILVVVRDEARALRPELILSVRSLGAGRRALFRYVYLPACLPAALTALRVSIGTAVAVLFFAESFATTSGLGYYIIVETWGRLDYPGLYAGVLAMSLLGLMLYAVTDGLERRLCPWMKSRH